MVSLLTSALLLFVPAGAWALASTAVLTEYAERRARIDVRAMRPTRGRVAPYFAVTAGPSSHSPLPIDIPSAMAAGPMSLNALRVLNGGGAGISLSPHAGSPPG